MKRLGYIIFTTIISLSLLLSSAQVHALDPTFTFDQTKIVFLDSTPKMRFYDVERGDQYNYFLFSVYDLWEVNTTGGYIDPRIVHLNSADAYHYALKQNTSDALKASFTGSVKFWTKTLHLNSSITAETGQNVADNIPQNYQPDGYTVSPTVIHYTIRWSNWDFANMTHGLNASFKFYSSDFSVSRSYGTQPLHFALEKTDGITILRPTNYISQGHTRQVSANDISYPSNRSIGGDGETMWYEFVIHFPAQTTEMGVDFDIYMVNNDVIDTRVNRPAPFEFLFGIVGIMVLVGWREFQQKKILGRRSKY